ncbi:MAG: hypothetical protein WBA00_11470 [Rhodococcus sp. (in: high G+C Gram-positive bacteria)]
MTAARALSAVLALASFLLGLLYAVSYLGMPSLVRRPLPPGQESLVVTIESFGPVWPGLFLLAGTAVALSATFPGRRSLVVAHMGAAFAWTFYGGSILVGAMLTQPPVPIVLGSMALLFPALHVVCALIWLQYAGLFRSPGGRACMTKGLE